MRALLLYGALVGFAGVGSYTRRFDGLTIAVLALLGAAIIVLLILDSPRPAPPAVTELEPTPDRRRRPR
jgi:hypothetical protein